MTINFIDGHINPLGYTNYEKLVRLKIATLEKVQAIKKHFMRGLPISPRHSREECMKQLINQEESTQYSLYDVFNVLREKNLVKVKFNKFLKSAKLQEILAGDKFAPAKIAIQAGKGTKSIIDYLITEHQKDLIASTFSLDLRSKNIKAYKDLKKENESLRENLREVYLKGLEQNLVAVYESAFVNEASKQLIQYKRQANGRKTSVFDFLSLYKPTLVGDIKVRNEARMKMCLEYDPLRDDIKTLAQESLKVVCEENNLPLLPVLTPEQNKLFMSELKGIRRLIS